MNQFEEVSSADQLRDPLVALLSDARANPTSTLNEQHQQIAKFELSDSVPIDVRVHFETAKNLYLYAWFVYRFYPVAEKQALATLEFALRERLAAYCKAEPSKNGEIPRNLSKLFQFAVNEQLITNDGLRANRRWAEMRARDRVSMEKMQEMIDQGLAQIEYDVSAVEPISEDYSRDWMRILANSLPRIRNEYAHGSSMLHPSVLSTFEIVTDLVNQLFKKA